MAGLAGFAGPVWRLVTKTDLADPARPARAPQGRFHHDGQIAVYASLRAEGTAVAIKRYLGDGVPRVLVPMWLAAARVADVSDRPEASVVWQDVVAAGERAPTWAFSDAARASGAQALLYRSRSRPDLKHVVVFDPACLRVAGAAQDYDPGAPLG